MTLISGTVTAVADQWANVRQYATSGAPDVGDLRVGDAVQYDPAPLVGGWYFVAGVRYNTWLRLASGFVAEKVLTITPDAAPVPVPYTDGIDISQAQLASAIDWKSVKAGGHDFAIIRATQGIADKDTAFVRHMDAALAAGLRVGVYHAFIASLDGAAQADFFHKTIYPYLDHLSFPPAIDVELLNGQSPRTLADRLRAMCLTMEALTGQKPMIYTAPGWWNGYVGSQWDVYFATLPLWTAHWTTAEEPLLPRPWRRGTWALWQWQVDENGIPGYGRRVDVNRQKA